MSKNNTANTSGIVSKVWAFCNIVPGDGAGYGDYLNQDFQDLKISRIRWTL